MADPVICLYYFVNVEKLYVWSLKKQSWRIFDAMSGGGRGVYDQAHKVTDPYGAHLERWLNDRDYRQKENQKHGIRGGPIPPGQYFVGKPGHHSVGWSSILTPDGPTRAFLSKLHRGGFYIHGRGPHGSDGCIVPLGIKIADFLKLVEELRAAWGDRIQVKVVPGPEVNRLQDLPATEHVPA